MDSTMAMLVMVSMVRPQKCDKPVMSVRVRATQQSTIRQIRRSTRSSSVMMNTATVARPMLRPIS